MLDLAARRQPPLTGSAAGIQILPPATRFILRGGAPVRAAVGEALGLTISEIACRSAQRDGHAALWLGPDEQLLLAPAGAGAETERALSAALSQLPHSLVDVSHRQVALGLKGPTAATLLNAGCPLSLASEEFPVGACTRTLLGKADIVLWRTESDTFHVEVWRSFARYVVTFLTEAARDVASTDLESK